MYNARLVAFTIFGYIAPSIDPTETLNALTHIQTIVVIILNGRLIGIHPGAQFIVLNYSHYVTTLVYYAMISKALS